MDLETPRLKLEPFNNSHYAGLRIMDGDSGVMRYITGGVVKTPEETREGIRRIQARWNKYKFSWWAIKEKASGVIVGAACLQHLANVDGAPFEIGWRLIPEHNGKGYATEAAKAIIEDAAERLGATYLVAVADPENIPSQRVMQRLGMTYKAIEQHYDVPCVVYELNIRRPA
ncbi:GNAT family N-acetyltransferase [Escherichia coli]|uniref:GNAT family N-acetyltransferase n=1 Tax=Escherichia coli TaxID=562 RepID=UPI00168B742F|nr:GNAT family N-acetyltransferase [Escherichia coli]EEW2161033.1 N-acetyltransferase [Escherichia coli]EFH4698766.1 GNAT family N-acetyltransferase [Escherichia coli]EFM0214089.1 GNAT family N-acetyltransferase [Escherichia coli]EFN4219681.1 GNAT family N-acetyltransferase [Escherichia coli]EFU9201689.1 GNAT family N-acetyltransferase [Escherichia coli]